VGAELPYLAAGAIAIAGGAIREHAWPSEGVQAALGTAIVVVFASATNGSRIEPLVRAFGMLVLLVAVIATVRSVDAAKKGRK
jgi:hypothetical protein